MKVYIVMDALSSDDYTTDEPSLLFISGNKQEAKDFFNDEIANWEDGMENHDSNTSQTSNALVYECTDFEADSHRIIKLIEVEL